MKEVNEPGCHCATYLVLTKQHGGKGSTSSQINKLHQELVEVFEEADAGLGRCRFFFFLLLSFQHKHDGSAD